MRLRPAADGPSDSGLTRRGWTGGDDRVRQVAVAAGALVAVAAAFVGSGAVVGTPIADAAGGVLSDDSTLVAPDTGAFRIWSVIYLGLVALAVLQLLPSRRSDPRQRRTGYLVLVSLVLNAVWILCVQAGLVLATVPVIAALLAVLVVAWTRLLRSPPSSRLEAVVVDGTVGLYLGWVSIATVANTAALLVDLGAPATGSAATVWAVVALVVAAGTGVLLAVAGRGRLAPAAALAWGLAWIAVGRAQGDPASDPTATAAVAAAAVVVLATLLIRLRARKPA